MVEIKLADLAAVRAALFLCFGELGTPPGIRKSLLLVVDALDELESQVKRAGVRGIGFALPSLDTARD
jgi:hypothetical protein